MSQPTQQPPASQPTGIVSNTRAAGARATEARAEVKKAWHKGPLFHLGVAIAAILVGVVLNQSYDFNLFWSMVIWVGLVKLGKVLGSTQADSWHVWGKVSRTAGWAVLLFALAQSGVRHFAEGSVLWLDQSLCTVWRSSAECGVTGTGASATTESAIIFTGKPMKIDLVHDERQRIRVPLEPRRLEMEVNLPAPTSAVVPKEKRLKADGVSDFYFCATAVPLALQSPAVNGQVLRELPGGNPYSYDKKVELNPVTRDLAGRDEIAIPVVEIIVTRVVRRSGQFRCP
jgi:hypothetical protein